MNDNTNEDSLSKEVKDVMDANHNLILYGNERIKCIITGHEMPRQLSAIEQYLNGKKYLRLTKNLEKTFEYKEYEPFVVASSKKGHKNQLFCTLTLRHINKRPPHILRHVQGKKYLRAKKRWEQCQKDGTKFVPTPYLSKSKKNESFAGGSDEEDLENSESDTDSLSDLYPVKYLEKMSLSDESMKEEAPSNSSTTNASGDSKRKHPAKPLTVPPQQKKTRFSKSSAKKKQKKTNLMVFT